MTVFLFLIIFVLLAALIYACYRLVIYRNACADWGKQYRALDQGMVELGEGMEADILDLKDRNRMQSGVIEDLVRDRSILYRAAVRCHKNCLPQYHDVPADEQEIYARLEYLQDA